MVDAKLASIITSPWLLVTPEITNQSDGAQHISAKFNFPTAYTFKSSDIITFGIAGGLTKNPEEFQDSLTVMADKLPDTTD